MLKEGFRVALKSAEARKTYLNRLYMGLAFPLVNSLHP